MTDAFDTDVLVAGGGPIGLAAAVELNRRGVDCHIVDPVVQPPQYAKAVGVQPRTLEVFEGMGILQAILDQSIPMRGQVVYVNGARVGELELRLPPDVPFGFICIPQYATEAVLRDELVRRGVFVQRGVAVTGFQQDDDGVTVEVGSQRVRARYLIGADGAHSAVRKALGCTFEGGAFEEQYMLGDLEVDWSLPRGYALRAAHQVDGTTDDLLVCIPLPGRGRYRMTMLVPPQLSAGDTPALSDIQTVLDRLAPEPVTARNLRWSSVFRISHRIVDSYGTGRVFVAGDAAHIHPPTGAQGMNTGIQDAHNLAWKLALAVRGQAADGLLATYDAERRPVGEEVVGRTVRSARAGVGADSADPDYAMRREAQLLISYAGSPIVADGAGERAPDATGLHRDSVTGPLRLFTLLNRRDHAVVLYAGTGFTDVGALEAVADAASDATYDTAQVFVVAAPDAGVADTVLPVIRDTDGQFAGAYGARGLSVFVIRPDGYLGLAVRDIAPTAAADTVTAHLRCTFA
ncbi:pentachlorophenol monooxygenase [Mycobacterium sp. MS1601]|uniref:FAD-dependent monooxygenase n=1 Tax=Mycobacterium sp. MS1601 TaxID=1936029 RepID=UPI00097957E8|nr:FAD-dependent monooxygenase [Mycobacterium sp. MS1601]AQA05298.1 pentachlorophenol monooxygenase [Mycobacterium sp. MS1601]